MLTDRREFLLGSLAALGAAQSRRKSPDRAQLSDDDIIQPTTDQVQQLIKRYVRAPNVPIGVAVGMASPSFGSQIILDGFLMDLNRNRLPFTVDTPFEVASNSKTVTTTLYEYFVQDGMMGASDNLGRYFSSSSVGALTDIPLLDLATYTSGLPPDNITVTDLPAQLTVPYTDSEMFQFLGSNPAFFSTVRPPGTVYSYSNLGFALLAHAVGQAVSGSDNYAQLANEIVLNPLGMTSTTLYESFSGSLPTGFTSQVDLSPQDDLQRRGGPGWIVLPAYNGAGGFVSTPQDMMTWLQFNMGMISSPSLSGLLPILHNPATPVVESQSSKLGVGWFAITVSNEYGQQLDLVMKDGELRGFTSLVVFSQPAPGCLRAPGCTCSRTAKGTRSMTLHMT